MSVAITGVLSFAEAREQVERIARQLTPVPSESVSLTEAISFPGRIIAQEVRADRDLPPFPRSTRDGFAIRSADATQPLRIVGEVRAGGPQFERELQAGEAVEIMTGAAAPKGADAVVMIEHVVVNDGRVTLQRAVSAGDNIVLSGAEAKAEDVLLATGARLSPAAMAVVSSVGLANVQVFRRPRVAVLATGDELVDIGGTPGPHQIRNSNSYSLAAQVLSAGAEPIVLPHAHDNADSLAESIRQALTCDAVLITGGVSAGKYDLVETVLAEVADSVDFHFTGVRIQPGKPTVFASATVGGVLKPVFGLPGNPVSTMVTFELFARSVLEAIGGRAFRPLVVLQATVARAVEARAGLTRFIPARVWSDGVGTASVEPIAWQGSGDFAAAARANCYLVIPAEGKFPAGTAMSVVMPGAEL